MHSAEMVMETKLTLSKKAYFVIKRTFDIFASLIGIIVLLPLFLITIIAIKLDSKGKAIFTQERIGLNGKLFKLYKFRSMVDNADEILQNILSKDDVLALEYRVNKKFRNDPRITRVGKIIRKLSIDELPQLLNVLKGDMSLIGNRPYLPREKEDMKPYYEKIVSTKPGITGLWQTSGRRNTTFKTRCKLEADYSEDASIATDIHIFFKTFIVVFKGLWYNYHSRIKNKLYANLHIVFL